MSLYCAMGSAESDVFPQLRGCLWKVLRSLDNEAACWLYPPTRAAYTPAPAI